MKKMMAILVIIGIALAGAKYGTAVNANGNYWGDIPDALPVLPQ